MGGDSGGDDTNRPNKRAACVYVFGWLGALETDDVHGRMTKLKGEVEGSG